MTTHSSSIDPAAAAIPAPFSNRFQVTRLDDQLVRMAFGERLGADDADTTFRSAVTMRASAARELALSILTMLGTTSATAS